MIRLLRLRRLRHRRRLLMLRPRLIRLSRLLPPMQPWSVRHQVPIRQRRPPPVLHLTQRRLRFRPLSPPPSWLPMQRLLTPAIQPWRPPPKQPPPRCLHGSRALGGLANQQHDPGDRVYNSDDGAGCLVHSPNGPDQHGADILVCKRQINRHRSRHGQCLAPASLQNLRVNRQCDD